MRGGDLLVGVLDQMQMLDQQVTPTRPISEQGRDLLRGARIDLPTLGDRTTAPAAGAGVFEPHNLLELVPAQAAAPPVGTCSKRVSDGGN
jgi:hypothetical protein